MIRRPAGMYGEPPSGAYNECERTTGARLRYSKGADTEGGKVLTSTSRVVGEQQDCTGTLYVVPLLMIRRAAGMYGTPSSGIVDAYNEHERTTGAQLRYNKGADVEGGKVLTSASPTAGVQQGCTDALYMALLPLMIRRPDGMHDEYERTTEVRLGHSEGAAVDRVLTSRQPARVLLYTGDEQV
eukprot:GGOE01000656.1.p3 GENE.GGOE01000656.1~~GGOE01000656.1.p3  ORF type:complete len:184 (+),score=5.30 GGOE01000656.1:306-857(+)